MAAWRILKSVYNLASSTYYIENTFYLTKIRNVYSLSTIFLKLTNNLCVNIFRLKTRTFWFTLITTHLKLYITAVLIYDCLNLGHAKCKPAFILCNKVIDTTAQSTGCCTWWRGLTNNSCIKWTNKSIIYNSKHKTLCLYRYFNRRE